MRHYILDTNVIISHPSVLARTDENTRIIIADSVLEELLHYDGNVAANNEMLKLVRNAFAHGVYRLKLPEIEDYGPLFDLPGDLSRISDFDRFIVKSVEYYIRSIQSATEEVSFVTNDRRVAEFAKSRGIRTIDSSQILKELANVSPHESIEKRATTIKNERRQRDFATLAVGFIAGIGLNVLATNLDFIVRTISVWGTVTLIPVFGVFMFWFRSRYGLTYGVIEITFGLVTSLRVFAPDFDYSRIDSTGFLQLAAGIYIFVRGMENTGRGLVGTRFETHWNNVFHN